MATANATTGAADIFEPEHKKTRERRLWSDAWRRMLRNRLAMLGLLALLIIAFVAFVGSHLALLGRYNSHDQNYAAASKQAAPSLKHWFGTDQVGRDMWARTLEGLRISRSGWARRSSCWRSASVSAPAPRSAAS